MNIFNEFSILMASNSALSWKTPNLRTHIHVTFAQTTKKRILMNKSTFTVGVKYYKYSTASYYGFLRYQPVQAKLNLKIGIYFSS